MTVKKAYFFFLFYISNQKTFRKTYALKSQTIFYSEIIKQDVHVKCFVLPLYFTEGGKMANEARNHKDNVFCLIYREKKYLLSLYNALNGTDYEAPEEIIVVTLENSICIGMKNDASFILDTRLNMYEHQSTVNPNMPLRSLLYLAEEYKSRFNIEQLYRSTKISIPEPRFVVFYNGEEEQPAIRTYRLSDMYETKSSEIDLELIVTVYNINPGKNEKLLESCESLKGYMTFVNKVRKLKKKNMDIEEAVRTALDECIGENIMVDFLTENKEKIINSSIWEFDQELNDKAKYEDGYENGVQQGQILLLKTLINDGNITIEKAAEYAGISEETMKQLIEHQ